MYVSSNVNIDWKQSPYTACVAIDENNFLLTNGMFKACLVALTDCWRYSSVHSVDGHLRNKLLGFPTPCVHKQSLWRIGDASEGDFTLVSGEGDALKVHSVVAMGCSPFFKAMMDTNMQEAVNKRLQVDISTAALQVAVGHFYGQNLPMTIIDAAELVGFAQMWCLPDLQKEAEGAFKTEPPRDTIQAAFLWKKAFEAQNSELRQYGALQMRLLLQMESEDMEESWNVEDKDLVHLWRDVARAGNTCAAKPYEIPSDTPRDTCL